MIELIDKEKELEFKNSFSDEEKIMIFKYFKILFKENDTLYFVLTTSKEEDLEFLRGIWKNIKNQAIILLGCKKLIKIDSSEEESLFFQKAIEICNIKHVNISIS